MEHISLYLMGFLGVLIAFFVIVFYFMWARRINKFSPFTENLLRSPGYTLGKKFDEVVTDILVNYLVLSLLPIIFMLMFNQMNTGSKYVAGAVALVVMIGSILSLLKNTKQAQILRLGYDGEVYTGQELSFLMRSGAWVYHDIPYQYGNIDHMVISTGGVFAIETKAVRKPANQDGGREYKVKLKGDSLEFPHITTSAPINQAKRHAEYVRQFLKRRTGNDYPVTPVVALPGWFVESTGENDCLAINPKRGKSLLRRVGQTLIAAKDTEIIANHIEEVARSVASTTDKSDPDAGGKYNFWLNRKAVERKM